MSLLVCANPACGKDLRPSYRIRQVAAAETRVDDWPDGTALSTTVKALVACSWVCLVAVVAEYAEAEAKLDAAAARPSDEEPF